MMVKGIQQEIDELRKENKRLETAKNQYRRLLREEIEHTNFLADFGGTILAEGNTDAFVAATYLFYGWNPEEVEVITSARAEGEAILEKWKERNG